MFLRTVRRYVIRLALRCGWLPHDPPATYQQVQEFQRYLNHNHRMQDLTTFLEKGQLPTTNRERGQLLDRLRNAYLTQSTLTAKSIPMTNSTPPDYLEAARTIASNPTKYAPRLVAAAKAALAANGSPVAAKPLPAPAKAPAPPASYYAEYCRLKVMNPKLAALYYAKHRLEIHAELKH